MPDEKVSLEQVIKITHEVLQIQDLDVLLQRILLEARHITNADAGSIYIVEGANLKFSYTQNNTLQKKLPAGKKLIYNTFSIPINSQSIAGYVATIGDILNTRDAYTLTPDKPYAFDKHFDEISGYRTTSMLTVPIKNYGGKVLGVIQLINARWSNNVIRSFSKDEESIVQLFADNAAAAIERAQTTRAMLLRMVAMTRSRDPSETFNHALRLAAYAVEVYEVWAHKKGIPEREIQRNRDILHIAATLHDIGKVAIPDNIFTSPSNLTPEQLEVTKKHTIEGAKFFQNPISDLDIAARDVVLNHHERWDGKGHPGHISLETNAPLPGYQDKDGKPLGKRGEEIPIFARIVAIADTFDALTSKYKWDEIRVLNFIQSESGKKFDPEVVAAFFSCIDTIRSIKSRYPD